MAYLIEILDRIDYSQKMKRDRIKDGMTASIVFFVILAITVRLTEAADLVIRIPGDLSQQDGYYRLYYKPEVGSPQVKQSKQTSERTSTNCS